MLIFLREKSLGSQCKKPDRNQTFYIVNHPKPPIKQTNMSSSIPFSSDQLLPLLKEIQSDLIKFDKEEDENTDGVSEFFKILKIHDS